MGREDVHAGAAREREGIGHEACLDALYYQQSRHLICVPGQGNGGGGDVHVGTAGEREGMGRGAYLDDLYCQQSWHLVCAPG